jgi:hypothetical protein
MQDVITLANELDKQVCAIAGGYEYTRGELSILFDRVADPANWKNAIHKIAVFRSDRERIGTEQAIEFFTGAACKMELIYTWSTKGWSTYRVTAAGYYATCGA